jgi:chromate reductase, NAD(P)H dehydrogenase (quinone)
MSERAVEVLAISGSLRSGSTNTELLRACVRLAPPDVQIRLHEGLGTLPHFNADLDTDDPPSAVAAWRAQVAAADALLIASPEYARGVPGSLKNALDWLAGSSDIVGKPVALLNGSPRATIAQESLAITLRTISATLVAEHPYVAPVLGRSLQAADIAEDLALSAVLRGLLDDLIRVVRANSRG